MIEISLYILTLIFSLIFLQMNHPLAMGLILLIQTTLISLISGLLTKTFWFSYVLFLTFLGGMLVLFMYVTSLASNEMFSLSMNLTIFSILIMSSMMIIVLFTDKTYFSSIFNNNEMTSILMLNSYTQENSLILNKLYNYPTNFITLLLIIYLLITLIAIVKITNVFYGPLRKMN